MLVNYPILLDVLTCPTNHCIHPSAQFTMHAFLAQFIGITGCFNLSDKRPKFTHTFVLVNQAVLSDVFSHPCFQSVGPCTDLLRLRSPNVCVLRMKITYKHLCASQTTMKHTIVTVPPTHVSSTITTTMKTTWRNSMHTITPFPTSQCGLEVPGVINVGPCVGCSRTPTPSYMHANSHHWLSEFYWCRVVGVIISPKH